MMKKWQTIIIFCVLFALIGVYGAIVSPTIVWGQDGTIPTRTPTPGAGEPTATSGAPTDTPPTDTPPTSTSPTDTPPTSTSPTDTPPPTSPPGTTATATATGGSTTTATVTSVAGTATPTSTIVGQFPFPEAEACGSPPTITTLVIVNVYEGPGSDYPVVETLVKDEVRPIIGRAQYATWWLILLDATGEQAWINDKAGIVNGYTGDVPIVTAPEIDGETPTPGTPWNPTPVPHCTVTPTATPTETATPTMTPTASSEAASNSETTTAGTTSTDTKSGETNTVASSGESTNTDSTTATDTEGESSAATESSGSAVSNSSPQTSNKNADTGETAQSEATAVPLESASSSSNANNILPIVGLVLIVGAVFVILFLRRGRGGGEATATDE